MKICLSSDLITVVNNVTAGTVMPVRNISSSKCVLRDFTDPAPLGVLL
jgi:hypothetical protein